MEGFTDNDAVLCTSKEERNGLLNLLVSHGVRVFQGAIDDMDNPGDYENYPSVVWSVYDGGMFTVSKMTSTMTVDEFKKLLNITIKPWGNSSLTFNFI